MEGCIEPADFPSSVVFEVANVNGRNVLNNISVTFEKGEPQAARRRLGRPFGGWPGPQDLPRDGGAWVLLKAVDGLLMVSCSSDFGSSSDPFGTTCVSFIFCIALDSEHLH